MADEEDTFEYMAEEMGIREDDIMLKVLRGGRWGVLLFLLALFTFLVLGARVLNYTLTMAHKKGGGKKRRQQKISVSASSSLPVYDEDDDDSTGVPFRSGARRTKGFVVRSSSKASLKIGMGMVPVVGMPARVGSCMAVDGETGTVYIYGGEGQDGGVSEDLLTFSQKDGDWSWTQPHGPQVPGPLARASLAVLPCSYLLLYGGEGPRGAVNGGVFVMDLETGEWNAGVVVEEEGEGPEPRSGASFEAWPGGPGWVLFGGVGQGSAHLSDVWLLSEVAGRQRGEVPSFRWARLWAPSEAPTPGPRKCHSAVITARGEMLVLGGYPEEDEGAVEGAAVDVFDLRRREWRRESVRGVGPSGGPGGRAFRVGAEGSRVLFLGPESAGVFNEVFVLTTDGAEGFGWLEAEVDWQGDWTVIPGGRTHYCAASDPANDAVFVFGGQDHSGIAQSQLLTLSAGDVLTEES